MSFGGHVKSSVSDCSKTLIRVFCIEKMLPGSPPFQGYLGE